MRQGDSFFLLIADDPARYPGKSYREREQYRLDLHWTINKKFPGYTDRQFRSSSEAAVLARQIQNYFDVTLEILPGNLFM